MKPDAFRLMDAVRDVHSRFRYIPEALEGTKDHWKTAQEFERDGGSDCEDGALYIARTVGIENGLYLVIGDVVIKSRLERHVWLAFKDAINLPPSQWWFADWTNGFCGKASDVSAIYKPLWRCRWLGDGFDERGEQW